MTATSPRPSRRASAPASVPAFVPPDLDGFAPFDDRRLLAYFEDLQQWHGYIRFLGLPHVREESDVALEELFVELELSERPIAPDLPLKEWPRRQGPLPALAEHPRLVLLGDPGSGKSTLVSWLTWRLTRGDQQARTALGPLIPLPMIVRELGITTEITWDGLVEAFLERPVAAKLDRARIEELLGRGACLVMADGLDEIGTPAVRRALRDALIEGVRRFPRNRWLLTSRIVGYDTVPFHRSEEGEEEEREPEVLEERSVPAAGAESDAWAQVRYVAPFTDSQIERFAGHWYAHREQARQQAEAKAADFLEAVHTHAATLRMARIPNLLTLMALIHRVQAWLPHGRALLYESIADAYLQTIDTFNKLHGMDFSLEEKKRWLAHVAFQMQLRRAKDRGVREVMVEEDQLLAWLGEAMARSPRPGEEGTEAGEDLARRFVDYVARRSGLLLPRGPGLYAFTHLSFQEFFAAHKLMEIVTTNPMLVRSRPPEAITLDDLPRLAEQETWRESLVLLFGLLAGRPGLSDGLLAHLFGEDLSRAEEEEAPAQLLAALAVDPHSGLEWNTRQAAWKTCWGRAQRSPSLRATLFSLDRRELPHLWRMILAGKPTVLNLSGASALNDLAPLTKLHNLQGLDLRGTAVSDLAPLAELHNLQKLYLSGTAVTDLAPIAKLHNLQELHLSRTAVSDLAPLAELYNIQTLILNETAISDLAPLAELHNLQKLILNGTAVSDLTPLAELHNLQTLLLSRTAISDLAPLAELHNLQWLYLRGTAVTDLSPVSHVKHIIKPPTPAA